MLLTDLQREGNRQHREGDHRKAYAMQVIGVSLVAFFLALGYFLRLARDELKDEDAALSSPSS